MITNFLSNKINLILTYLICWVLILYTIMNGIESTSTRMFLISLILISNILHHIWGISRGVLHTLLTHDEMIQLFEDSKSGGKMSRFMEKYNELHGKDDESK